MTPLTSQPVNLPAESPTAGGVRSDIFNEDCIAGMAARIPDRSVHLTVTSIPFEELFTYSGKAEDVGNNGSTVDIRAGRFALNMRFVVEQLFRVTAPGCNVCIHIQQLLAYKNQHGFMGRRDFRGAMIDVFGAGGFLFTGEFVIPKDPQAMAQRLSLHSLQFKTGYHRNATNLAPAVNDYVLIFQRPGEIEFPVRCLIHREKNPEGWVTTDEWIRWASGVWGDIDEFDILDGARHARESEEEKHVCPLQLEVIRRCIRLYTNPARLQPNVTVLDPFMGIGSTAHEAILLGRNVVGFELKESYAAIAVKNCARARAKLAAEDRKEHGLFSVPQGEELEHGTQNEETADGPDGGPAEGGRAIGVGHGVGLPTVESPTPGPVSSGDGETPAGDAEEVPARDELYDLAWKICIEAGRLTVSSLQRKMEIGYCRAYTLAHQLRAGGIEGAIQTARPAGHRTVTEVAET